ncbi:MAG TPA: AMP-binding protein [Terriglobales bacterium]|nr:AMP-binding protein [Terriglobales bacterium]
MERQTLQTYLDDFLRLGEECACVYPRGYRWQRWSYRRLAETAFRFARELQARHIVKGDAVILWSVNCAEWVAAFWGCALCGVTAVPLDDGSSPDFARRIREQVKAKLVLCPQERAAIFGSIASIDPVNLESAISTHAADSFRAAEIKPSDPLEIVFTSGTTAEPKGVVISHANVLGNIGPIEKEMQQYRKYERLVHPIRFLNLLPLSHVFGQFLAMFLPTLLGGTVVFEQSLNPTEVMATIRRERVSVLVAVPRMMESLKLKIERDLDDSGRRATFGRRYAAAAQQHFLRRWWTFRDVRSQFGRKFWAMISGGAALDRDTEEFWHRLGYAVIQGYGLTETTSLISLNHPFHTSRGSIGKILPGREVRLAHDGEILVRGSGVASGYWSGGTMQAVAGDEGWYATGDLGALDGEGNLHFRGRKKEVIVTSSGMNVYPEDLEAALRCQPEVRDCVVVGMARGGNAEPCAVLILRGETGDAKAIVARANELLREYQKMRAWFEWPEEDFPRTSTGKPRRNVIREAIAANLASTSTGEGARDSIAATSPLAELMTKVTGRATGELSRHADLEVDMGLSSLDRVELLGALEDRYQVDLSETKFASAATVGDLEKLLQNGQGERREFHYPRWTLRWPLTWVRLAAQYLLVRPAVFLLGWPRMAGRENLRGLRGPVLVIANHIGNVDVGFIQTVLPARIRHRLATATGGEALEILRSPAADRWWGGRGYDRLKWMLGVALLNLFPLPRQAGFRKSFAYAGEAVDRGYSVLVFPEGRHTEDGSLRPFRSGIGLLVNNLRLPVVPIRIDGLFEVKEAGKKFATPGQIEVRIGEPIAFAADRDPAEIAQELQRAVEAL